MPVSLTESLRARSELMPPETNAFRVIDGYAGGYDGVFVDFLDGRLLVSTRGRDIPNGLWRELNDSGMPVYHKRLDQHVKEAPAQIAGEDLPARFGIMEQGVKLWLDMDAGYSQGLFLDQRDNRQRVRMRCREGDRVLNTFAYTGAFSVYAAMGGAISSTLDLAQPGLDWAKENFSLNGIDPATQYFCKGDTFHWLERFARQKKQFNGIILDPPTFSRNENGKVFRVESHYGDLVKLASSCLAPGGWILCTTNCRTLSVDDFSRMVKSAATAAKATVYGMPPDFNGEQYLKTIWLDY